MNAQVIAVGSELLTSGKIDTNSLYLTRELNVLGVEVVEKSIVGDDRERLTEAVRTALAHCEVVILTGGLGPTEDDVTRDAVAAALGRTQYFNDEICDALEARFRKLKRAMVTINRRQAYVIEGAEVLPNACGTAPGQWIVHGDRIVMLLPGPPRELKPMFESQCLPRLRPLLPEQVIAVRHYRVACMPESDLDALIAPVYTKYTNPVTTVLGAVGDIQVFLRARTDTEAEALALLNEVGTQVEALLGDRIYSKNGDNLEATLVELMRAREKKLGFAESATGGLLAQRVTSVPGSSEVLIGGVVAYSDQLKQSLLGVSPMTLAEYSAVSEPVAREMAI
ncbi:MAG TPA: CinA family nicotinamide mononucleotide deamidase-related protein, partial [Bryobacteraceae bacterium]|nr:CinA family nicotinamide mononucleotide deamidase-related protein [Bryobacteraceae bacterium]